MDSETLDALAAELTARFKALGINAEPGYAGSVLIYASDEQARTILAALGKPAA